MVIKMIMEMFLWQTVKLQKIILMVISYVVNVGAD